tara:strand:+ start:3493 stop:3678 length:186 start_codon:yes stop_codon:yes gene_type:complete
MKNTDWKSVKERTDEYDKANTWEHLDKFDNSHECESEEYDKFGCATIVLVDSSKLKTKENK